ncbi:MAG: ATP-binding protein [bacterium]
MKGIVSRPESYDAKLTIPSNYRYIEVVRELVESVGHKMGYTEQAINEMKIAISEACTNVIKHAYRGEENHTLTVFVSRSNNDHLEIVIVDNGEKFDFYGLPEPVLGEARESGYGVFLMKRFMDVVEYDPSSEYETRLRMIKFKR